MSSPELDKPAAPAADEQAEQRRLLAACQLLLDPVTLRVLGALAQQPQAPVALAASVGLDPSQVYQRLAQLQRFDLVAETAQTYRFRAKSLAPLRRALGRLNRAVYGQAPAEPAPQAADAAEQRLLARFVRDGRLVELPTHPRKLLVVLRWLASQFVHGRRYSEREVNAVMLRYHEDYMTLRRELINHMLMARDHEAYWRLPAPSEAR